MGRAFLAMCRLDEVRVAPGRLVIAGVHYAYDSCSFTIEELSDCHMVVVTEEGSSVPDLPELPSRWTRLRRRLGKISPPSTTWGEGYADAGYVVDE